ncbi:hypothetical protein [Pararhodonellum marinum]|uniref:hypothetical protein n=1 Tax=Pararhodonellum marinum TaxID=2755358 RepID=UPI00188E3E2F|nr:hypothetical protein [Pararhodonellum marinum]
MKTVKLDIKEPLKIARYLKGLGWIFLVVSLFLFLIDEGKLEQRNLLIAMSFIFSMVLFISDYLLLPRKKTGEIKLDNKQITICRTRHKKEIPFEEVVKIKVILANRTDRFHRDWWPLNDAPTRYESSSENLLDIKTRNGKNFYASFHLDQKRTERKLVQTLRQLGKKYRVKLRVY